MVLRVVLKSLLFFYCMCHSLFGCLLCLKFSQNFKRTSTLCT